MIDLKLSIKREMNGWKKWQLLWLVLATLVILGVSIYQKDSWIGILASVSGVICVIFCGMGRISNYLFGTVNTILYAYIAWRAKYYGDVMLNMLYYLPTNIIGWIAWKKNMNADTNEVYKKRMSLKMDLLLAIVSMAGVFGYAYVLKLLGGNLPLVDSMSTVFSIIAQILMIKRFMEQWVVWIIVDVVSVIMWIAALSTDGASVAVLLMWSVFLINAVIMFVKWFLESKKAVKND
ncbi:MAG: nicotinamide mononucleotide transporter [Treponema sp.]|nr:nicotinamide mononucleotide transporter [Treponema sp.]